MRVNGDEPATVDRAHIADLKLGQFFQARAGEQSEQRQPERRLTNRSARSIAFREDLRPKQPVELLTAEASANLSPAPVADATDLDPDEWISLEANEVLAHRVLHKGFQESDVGLRGLRGEFLFVLQAVAKAAGVFGRYLVDGKLAVLRFETGNRIARRPNGLLDDVLLPRPAVDQTAQSQRVLGRGRDIRQIQGLPMGKCRQPPVGFRVLPE